eukprot:gb/GFBE01013208.1/.p1 GENE.gb/GFBE01013208.1/~~gb/GFBE01013208.1/.p1  ORF type:complete len:194 (+),score=46.29 gb/GFBE01013208.1/:1-582(+)
MASKGGCVVTGGLKGPGLIMAREMASQGHSPVITVSRSGRATMPVEALQELDVIQERTAHHDVRCDLSDASAVSDLLARYQGSVGPVRQKRCAKVTMRVQGSAECDLDALEVYGGYLDQMRDLLSKPEIVTKEKLSQWKNCRDNLSEALVKFKKDLEAQPYSKESHMARVQLEDIEQEMSELIISLAKKAGIE